MRGRLTQKKVVYFRGQFIAVFVSSENSSLLDIRWKRKYSIFFKAEFLCTEGISDNLTQNNYSCLGD